MFHFYGYNLSAITTNCVNFLWTYRHFFIEWSQVYIIRSLDKWSASAISATLFHSHSCHPLSEYFPFCPSIPVYHRSKEKEVSTLHLLFILIAFSKALNADRIKKIILENLSQTPMFRMKHKEFVFNLNDTLRVSLTGWLTSKPFSTVTLPEYIPRQTRGKESSGNIIKKTRNPRCFFEYVTVDEQFSQQ